MIGRIPVAMAFQFANMGGRMRFDSTGSWTMETKRKGSVKTRQVIGRRREVSSKQERGIQRRKRLVEAARHFLESQGPQDISFKAIARQADVPEGSAYHFFANKYDVFSALAADIGEEFVQELARPIPKGRIANWQEFIALIIDRSANLYRSDPVARKVLLGTTMPNEVRKVDQENIEDYISSVEARFYELFDAPSIVRLSDRLMYALTMIDAIFELDLSENDNLTLNMVEEAKVMMTSYLANFIPEDTKLKQPLSEDQ